MFARLGLIGLMLAALLGGGAAYAEIYKVGSGDKLRISIYQWDALNNTYTVDPDGSVALPIVGTVHVAGEGTQDIGLNVAQLLAKKMKLAEAPTASVEVVQFRTFSILGDVAKPGDYSYRPGMIVLDALAMAGGYYRPERQALETNRNAALDKGKFEEDAAKLMRLYLRRARLEAAVQNKNSFDKQDAGIADGDGDDVGKAYVQEAAIFADQRSELKSKLTASDILIASLGDQIAKQTSQLAAINDELDGLIDQKNNVRSLVKRGVSTNTRETSLDVIIGDVTRTKFEIEADLLRLRQQVKVQEQTRDELTLTFHDKSQVQMADVDGDIATLKSNMKALDLLMRNEGAVSADEEVITIVRRTADGLTRSAAKDMDRVAPDDIVMFEKKAEGK